MKFTDDTPVIIEGVKAISAGPVFVSNHSQFGFNLRHFYEDWRSGELKPSKNGISIDPRTVMALLEGLVQFINENGLGPDPNSKVVIAIEKVGIDDAPG